MSISIVFPGSVMEVIHSRWCQVLKPVINILYQAGFGIIDIHRRGDVHGGNQNHSFLDAAFLDSILNLAGDIDVFAALMCVEPEIFGMEFHHWPPRAG